jgi:DNA mismatch repair protein MutS2
VRKIRNSVGAEEASALRKAERQAQAQDDPGAQEDASKAFRGAAGEHLATDLASEGDVDREALEFDVVLLLISSFARTPPGKAAVRRLVPAFDEPSVRRRIDETAELIQFRLDRGRLGVAGVEEIGPVLDSLERSGGAGALSDFAPILAVARAAVAVRRDLAPVSTPHLIARRGRLPDFDDLILAARRLFEADGSLRDDASPALARMRSQLRKQRGQVTRQLQKLLQIHRQALGEAVVVLRNDRYCLPIAVSSRARVPGIVHDRSGSGQTVFVEPMEIVESNNELALLAAEEKREVERLIAEFGRQVLGRADELRGAVT